jgi:hypothetical protein
MPTLDEIVSSSVKDSTTALEGVLVEDGSVTGTLQGAPDVSKIETTTKEGIKEDKTKVEESEFDEFGLTRQQQIEARQLLAALRDPTKAPTVIEFLAKHGGYEKPETKKEAVQVKKGMVADLKEALGPELEYLADKMGPVFQRYLDEQVEGAKGELKGRLDQADLEKNEQLADQAQEALGREYFDGTIPDKLTTAINSLIDEIPVRPGQSMKSYLERLLVVAAAEQGVSLTKKTLDQVKKIAKNRTDAPARLASAGTVSPKEGERAIHPNRQMGLLESVQSAIEQASKA